MNGWLETRDSRQTIRTLDGNARAFLSDRYRRIDNYEIATATLPVIGEMEGVRIESCEITENRMYLKAVWTAIIKRDTHAVRKWYNKRNVGGTKNDDKVQRRI